MLFVAFIPSAACIICAALTTRALHTAFIFCAVLTPTTDMLCCRITFIHLLLRLAVVVLCRDSGSDSISAEDIEARFDGNICRCTGIFL